MKISNGIGERRSKKGAVLGEGGQRRGGIGGGTVKGGAVLGGGSNEGRYWGGGAQMRGRYWGGAVLTWSCRSMLGDSRSRVAIGTTPASMTALVLSAEPALMLASALAASL